MDKRFQIGSFCFRLVCPIEVPVPENFLKFEVSHSIQPHYTYRLELTEQLPDPEGKILANRQDLAVYGTSAGEERIIGIKGQKEPYAKYCEVSENEAKIIFLKNYLNSLQIDTIFTSLFSLELRMVQRDSLILHCAYIVFQGKAILFSAPSETGKSTQAALWEKYRGSNTVNGDRALMRKVDGIWIASSWPVCGSSEICNLGDTPIYAIVMLRQGKKNIAERLTPFQAFASLYSQITINQWNKDYIQRAIGNLEDLMEQVPIWQLTCDISEDAVLCLERALFR